MNGKVVIQLPRTKVHHNRKCKVYNINNLYPRQLFVRSLCFQYERRFVSARTPIALYLKLLSTKSANYKPIDYKFALYCLQKRPDLL